MQKSGLRYHDEAIRGAQTERLDDTWPVPPPLAADMHRLLLFSS
jgi:hypothetical protein